MKKRTLKQIILEEIHNIFEIKIPEDLYNIFEKQWIDKLKDAHEVKVKKIGEMLKFEFSNSQEMFMNYNDGVIYIKHSRTPKGKYFTSFDTADAYLRSNVRKNTKGYMPKIKPWHQSFRDIEKMKNIHGIEIRD